MKKLLLILLCVPLIGFGQRHQTGCISGNCKNGTGTYVFAKDVWDSYDKYVGEFKKGKMHGQGTFTFANGDKYTGEYKKGVKDGKGTFIYEKEGEKYVGEFKDGKIQGEGIFTFSNGDEYVGEFNDGNRHGKGTYITADGQVHEGLWDNGELIGE